MSVRRIYFTLPKERRCCDSHCLGKKPGCKLSETLRRESQHARTHSMTHTRRHTPWKSAEQFVVFWWFVTGTVFLLLFTRRCPLLSSRCSASMFGCWSCRTVALLWRKRGMRKRRTGGSVFFSHSTGIRVGLSPRRAEGKYLHKKIMNKYKQQQKGFLLKNSNPFFLPN